MFVSMKSPIATLLTLFGLLLAGPAAAEHKPSHKPHPHDDYAEDDYRDDQGPGFDYATVLRSVPVSERVRSSRPRERCWEEEVAVENEPRSGGSMTGTLIGGIVGAAIGNAVGHNKSNKRVGAVAGGLLGASIGNDVTRGDRSSEQSYDTRERCETVDEVQYLDEIVGYDVTYRYRGQTRTTRLDHDPGNSLRVRVDVTPAE